MWAEYPKWLYHATEPARVVETATEEAALGDGWFPTPELRPLPVVEPPENNTIRGAWVEFAGMIGVEVDGRWKLQRIKDEVRKAVDDIAHKLSATE